MLFSSVQFSLFVLCFKTKITPTYTTKKFSKAQEDSEMTIRSFSQLPPSKEWVQKKKILSV